MQRLHWPTPIRSRLLDGQLLVAITGLVSDSVTFLFLPTGSEANPIVNLVGVEGSLIIKSLLIGYLVFLWTYLEFSETHMMVYAIAIAGGFLGLGSNLSVLLAH